MSLAEGIQVVQAVGSLGLFSGVIGLIKWGWMVERRLLKIEMKTGVHE